MTAAIEIYTRPGCGYCSAAKSLLTRKKATFTERDVAVDAVFGDRLAGAVGGGAGGGDLASERGEVLLHRLEL